MKCIKYTYKSPMFGSVLCPDAESFGYGQVDLNPETMEQIHNRGNGLGDFLRTNMDDLVSCVPEHLEDLVVKAEFGDFTQDDEGMCFLTEIYCRRVPEDVQLRQILSWITGQMSDGWGEGLEQRQFMKDRVEWTQPVFNEDEGIWESEEFTAFAAYYVHPWTPDFRLELIDDMVVEIDVAQDDRIAELQKAVEEMKRQIRELDVAISNLI